MIHKSRERFRRDSLTTTPFGHNKITENKSESSIFSTIFEHTSSLDLNSRPLFDLEYIRNEMQLRNLRLNRREKEFEELKIEIFSEIEGESKKKITMETVPTLTSPKPEEDGEEIIETTSPVNVNNHCGKCCSII